MSGRSPPTTPGLFAAGPEKKAIFWPFFDPFPGRGRSCFEAALGPEEGPEARARKAYPCRRRSSVPEMGVYGPGLTESGHGQPGRVPARLASRGVWQSLP